MHRWPEHVLQLSFLGFAETERLSEPRCAAVARLREIPQYDTRAQG